MGAAFYEPLGDGRFASTAHTAGPWTAESQHVGPPSALLVRALEDLLAWRMARSDTASVSTPTEFPWPARAGHAPSPPS